ncbi:MAG: Gfo/Idh/MocA family oxidoreductase [Actinomycetota bacterium]|nr:Gfo/Idh/MocA family oxidoreductase [Actinomycetota bacterium]
MAVVFRDDQHWPLEAHYGSTWRADRRVVGSGTLLEHSIHDLDLIRWLFGDPCRVAAAVGNHAGRPGVEDAAVALLEIRQGPVVTLTSLWHEMAGRRSERSLEALGRRGRLRVEADFWGALEWQGEEGAPRVFGPEEVLEMAAHHHGWDETERRLARVAPLEDYWFLRSLSTGAAPAPSMAEGLAAHQLVDRIYQAAKSSSSS